MKTALLLVDVQKNMLEGEYPVPPAQTVQRALESLLKRARKADATIVHVQNDGPPGDPDEPGTEGWHLVFTPNPDEMVVQKPIPDTFAADTALALRLKERGVGRVIVAGMQSEFCVSATALGALGSGFEVVLASGAHATYDGEDDASTRSKKIEEDLSRAGIEVVDEGKIEFY